MSESLFAIARSGMDVERLRMEVIAQNLANAGSVRSQGGEVYQPMRLISGPNTVPSFQQVLGQSAQGYSLHAPGELTGTRSYGVQATAAPPRIVHEPANPAADKDGNVAYPGVDHAGEMALMVQTQRVYEANVVMYNSARSMYMRAMDIGGNNP
ncbi:MAG: flagellar basal body rod protein FlgC [Lysobacter sp.]